MEVVMPLESLTQGQLVELVRRLSRENQHLIEKNGHDLVVEISELEGELQDKTALLEAVRCIVAGYGYETSQVSRLPAQIEHMGHRLKAMETKATQANVKTVTIKVLESYALVYIDTISHNSICREGPFMTREGADEAARRLAARLDGDEYTIHGQVARVNPDHTLHYYSPEELGKDVRHTETTSG